MLVVVVFGNVFLDSSVVERGDEIISSTGLMIGLCLLLLLPLTFSIFLALLLLLVVVFSGPSSNISGSAESSRSLLKS